MAMTSAGGNITVYQYDYDESKFSRSSLSLLAGTGRTFLAAYYCTFP